MEGLHFADGTVEPQPALPALHRGAEGHHRPEESSEKVMEDQLLRSPKRSQENLCDKSMS